MSNISKGCGGGGQEPFCIKLAKQARNSGLIEDAKGLLDASCDRGYQPACKELKSLLKKSAKLKTPREHKLKKGGQDTDEALSTPKP